MVLAHIGCHVPASFASVRCVDRLLTRMGAGDSLEAGASSFMLEMQARLDWRSAQLPVYGRRLNRAFPETIGSFLLGHIEGLHCNQL